MLAKKLKGQMINLAKDTKKGQMINLASKSTNIPISGTSNDSGSFGSKTVTVGTPAQYISISDYGSEYGSEV
jgi:hypothetical protein